jgi:HAD superfamily hydrolase (TIGR01509 family)
VASGWDNGMTNFNEIQALIFDMNGVIVDDEHLHRQAYEMVFDKLGHSLSQADYDDYFVGRVDEDAFRDACAAKCIEAGLEDCLELKCGYYRELAAHNLVPLPGVLDFIAGCAARYPLALATSAIKAEAGLIMREFNLEPYFKAMVTAEDVTRGKPDPQVFWLAARRLGVAPEHCLVVEDSTAGVEAAKAAGMACLAITSSYGRRQLSQADLIIDSFVGLQACELGL